jgi:catechol 2,3-dioxygenase-like lactoylglutathione lyase family enzyme
MAILTWLGIPGEAEAWQSLGFAVSDGRTIVGRVTCATGHTPAWGFDELNAETSDLGVETRIEPAPPAPGEHPNLIDRIDHVVYWAPDLDVAVDSLTAVLGAPPRRRFRPRGESGPEMAFFRVGEGFIEVVGSPQPAGLWGIAFSSPNLDATVEAIRAAGGPIGDPKEAVQGGRIASVWKEHVGWGVAVMEPPRR